jgi:predicted nuclease of restriction endonuclease-like (RecB) superfamily
MKVKNRTSPISEYQRFLSELKDRIEAAREQAARSVNHELVLLYWDIGGAILEKQRAYGWGESVVERLSNDLRKAYPDSSGFSSRNLWDMRRFHETWSRPQILRQAVAEIRRPFLNTPNGMAKAPRNPRQPQPRGTKQILRQLVAEIPWGHHLVMLNKAESDEELIWYLRASKQFGWSRNVLLNQINAGAYQRSVTLPKQSNFSKALKAELANQASEALKSTYSLDFLGIAQVINERDLETRLIDRIRDFILELGYGFCFVGRQHRLTLGRKEYYIDLLFYHRFLRSLVAIDVKVNEFQPEHVGKMDFYLNLLNRKERAVGDNPSIGIILCAENDALEVEYSLSTRANPIGVASYRLLNELPERLQGKLPTARQLKRALSDALQDMPDGRSIASEPIATYGLKRPASIF